MSTTRGAALKGHKVRKVENHKAFRAKRLVEQLATYRIMQQLCFIEKKNIKENCMPRARPTFYPDH